ncbi:MAG: hypothetical protein V2A69_13665 [Pseudomonadota bacterium]
MQTEYLQHNMSVKVCIILIATLFFTMMANESALAHKVNIFAYVEGDTVFTESYFNDGRKCVHSNITVFDRSGNQLLEGMTNEEGEFSFKIPEKVTSDLRIVLTASMGHKSDYILPASDFSADLNKGRDAAAEVQGEIPPERGDKEEKADVTPQRSVDITTVQSVVEEALDRKLGPIIKSLAKIEHAQKGPSITEVIGGIGYIFGIVGIVIYFRNRYRR